MQLNRVGGRWHRFRRWCHLRVDKATVLSTATGLIAICVSALAITDYPMLSWTLVVVSALLAFTYLRLEFQRQKISDEKSRRLVERFFHFANEEIFEGSGETRFTLFRCDPIYPAYIVPYVRYSKGQKDGIDDALSSKAHYKKNEGLTGRAWKEAGASNGVARVFPKFKSKEHFTDYYVNNMGISREVVGDLSDYMQKVESMFCYGFVDSYGNLTGVLSLDMEFDWEHVDKYLGPDDLKQILYCLNAILPSL